MYPFIRLGTNMIKSVVKRHQGHSLTLTDVGEITRSEERRVGKEC